MTHPSADEVALHLEGLLAPAEERRVGAHLRECSRCAATARDLTALPEVLRTAGAADTEAPPPMPADVARRVDAALAREGVPGRAPEIATLDDRRRRRRRRVLGAGLLAAAAATVVAVGLGQLVRTGGSGEAASGRAQQESAVAADRPSGQPATRPARTPRGRADAGVAGGGVLRPDAELQAQPFGDELRSRLAGLVDGVAAVHSPDRPRHDRDACVRTALGLAATGGPAPPASYAVALPGRAAPGVVVLRPSKAPTQGLVVACDPRPRVLLSRGLDH